MTLPAAPLDSATGMPPMVLTHYSRASELTNYHHVWFPKRSDELLADYPYVDELRPETYSLHELGGMAVRMSRGQIMPIDVHVRFHQQYAGPPLPETNYEKFVVAVSGCAGVVPRWGLDLSKREGSQRVALDIDAAKRFGWLRAIKPEYHYYWHHKVARRRLMGEYFVRYAIMQDFQGASRTVVDEFLHTHAPQRRLELGNFLLTQALDASVQPLLPNYSYQKRNHMVRQGAPEPLSAIKKHLMPQSLPRYHDYLRDRLLAA